MDGGLRSVDSSQHPPSSTRRRRRRRRRREALFAIHERSQRIETQGEEERRERERELLIFEVLYIA